MTPRMQPALLPTVSTRAQQTPSRYALHDAIVAYPYVQRGHDEKGPGEPACQGRCQPVNRLEAKVDMPLPRSIIEA